MGSDQTLMNSNIPRIYNGVLTGSYNYDFILQVGNFPAPTRQFTFSYDMSNNNTNNGARPQSDGYRVEFRTYNAAGQRLNYYDTRDRSDSFPLRNFTTTYNLADDAVRWDIGFRLIDNGFWNGNFAGSIDNVSLTTQVPVTTPETYTYGADETAAKDSASQILQSAQSALSSAISARTVAEARLAAANAEVVRLNQLIAELSRPSCVNPGQEAATAAAQQASSSEPVVTEITTCGGDDTSYQVPLSVDVTFDGRTFNRVYATTNSVITFGAPDGTYWDYPRTPSISLYSFDWVVYPNARADEHLIIRSSDGGFQVDISARPIWLQNATEPTNIVITAAILSDGTVAMAYTLTGPEYPDANPRTGVRLNDVTVVTF